MFDEIVRHELSDETSLNNVYLEQLHATGSVHRDSCERVLTVACHALVKATDQTRLGATDADEAQWFASI